MCRYFSSGICVDDEYRCAEQGCIPLQCSPCQKYLYNCSGERDQYIFTLAKVSMLHGVSCSRANINTTGLRRCFRSHVKKEILLNIWRLLIFTGNIYKGNWIFVVEINSDLLYILYMFIPDSKTSFIKYIRYNMYIRYNFPRYWPFVRGIHRPPVNSPHKGQWRGALMLSLICAWMNGWVNTREAGD